MVRHERVAHSLFAFSCWLPGVSGTCIPATSCDFCWCIRSCEKPIQQPLHDPLITTGPLWLSCWYLFLLTDLELVRSCFLQVLSELPKCNNISFVNLICQLLFVEVICAL